MSRARSRAIVIRASEADMPDYASEVAGAIHRLADVGELIAGGLFAIAAGQHTKHQGDQRDMAAVFWTDAASRYGDVWKKLDERQRQDLERFISGICKGKR